MAKLCEVCATSESKYKCPTCRLPYCSAACYKRHKETPCASSSAAAAATAASGGAAPPAPATGASETGASETGAAPTASSDQQAAGGTGTGEETETESEDDGPRLTVDQLGLLKTSDFVRKHLGNPAIVQALAQIDAAPDRMKELEKAMLDQTFASFICQSLDEVAATAPTTRA